MASSHHGNDEDGASLAPLPPGVQEVEGLQHKKRGVFIVLEGLDRSGKTTQVKLLQERLVEAGKEVRSMRFPGEFVFLLLYLLFVGCNRWDGGAARNRDDQREDRPGRVAIRYDADVYTCGRGRWHNN